MSRSRAMVGPRSRVGGWWPAAARFVAAGFVAAGFCASLTFSSVAHADEPTVAPTSTSAPAPAADADLALYEKGRLAFEAGDYGAAIDTFEALADRGFLHPAVSYARGLAYLKRVSSTAEKPGDLGRAAAAFEETLRLDASDKDADRLLDAVRGEVTRRRSRKGSNAVDVRPTLDRVIAAAFSDRTWTLAAVVASFLLAIGLVFRRFDAVPATSAAESDPRFVAPTADTGVTAKKSGPAHPIHVTGSVLVAVGIVALLALVPIAWHARTLRATTRPGVIVAPEAHFTDETGRAAGGDPVPEAAAVEVGERREGILHVRWGASEGWLPATSVRVLP